VLAERQHGLITREQVLALGGSDVWLYRAVRNGRLRRVRQGVYAVAGSVSEYQPLMAACLAAGPKAALSHLAAASLWGADQVLTGTLEITSFDNLAHDLNGVKTHRSRLDPTLAVTTHHGLPVVVPPLTVIQVAETCHPYLAQSVANDLVKHNWTTFAQILDWIEQIGDRRQRCLRDLCLQAIEVGGHNDSPAARLLCQKLRAAGVEPFELDYPVSTPQGVSRIDIAWPRRRLGLEYNGARDHDGQLARVKDERRRNILTAMGWRILDANRGMTHEEIIRWVKLSLRVTSEGG